MQARFKSEKECLFLSVLGFSTTSSVGHTREDRPIPASQLSACYASVKPLRSRTEVIGEEEVENTVLRMARKPRIRGLRRGRLPS